MKSFVFVVILLLSTVAFAGQSVSGKDFNNEQYQSLMKRGFLVRVDDYRFHVNGTMWRAMTRKQKEGVIYIVFKHYQFEHNGKRSIILRDAKTGKLLGAESVVVATGEDLGPDINN